MAITPARRQLRRAVARAALLSACAHVARAAVYATLASDLPLSRCCFEIKSHIRQYMASYSHSTSLVQQISNERNRWRAPIRWLELCFVLSISEPTPECSSSAHRVLFRSLCWEANGARPTTVYRPRRAVTLFFFLRRVTLFPPHGWWKPIAPNCRSAARVELLLLIRRKLHPTVAH
jgi:hypothetical protein